MDMVRAEVGGNGLKSWGARVSFFEQNGSGSVGSVRKQSPPRPSMESLVQHDAN